MLVAGYSDPLAGYSQVVVDHRESDPDDHWTEHIPVLASATADDVRGKVVYGTLPLHLAALAVKVHAIEFPDYPHERDEEGNVTRGYMNGPLLPRGAEYTLAEMDAAGHGWRATPWLPATISFRLKPISWTR